MSTLFSIVSLTGLLNWNLSVPSLFIQVKLGADALAPIVSPAPFTPKSVAGFAVMFLATTMFLSSTVKVPVFNVTVSPWTVKLPAIVTSFGSPIV